MQTDPRAVTGLKTYRYRGPYAFVWIGAKTTAEALREAKRSLDHMPDVSKLEVWNGEAYVAA